MRQSTPITSPPASRTGRQQRRIARGEMDHRRAGREALDHAAAVGQDIAAIIVFAETADPTVEELHDLRPAQIWAFK